MGTFIGTSTGIGSSSNDVKPRKIVLSDPFITQSGDVLFYNPAEIIYTPIAQDLLWYQDDVLIPDYIGLTDILIRLDVPASYYFYVTYYFIEIPPITLRSSNQIIIT